LSSEHDAFQKAHRPITLFKATYNYTKTFGAGFYEILSSGLFWEFLM
jgi:hypothetical protein